AVGFEAIESCADYLGHRPRYRAAKGIMNRLKYSIKTIWVGLTCALLLHYTAPASPAQTTPGSINIVVLEGEGAVDNYRQHVEHIAVVRVEDENQTPIPDAAVVFTLPTEGSTGVFGNGSKTLITKTDKQGLASAKGMRVNDVSGKLVIHVTASYRGLTTHSLI